MSDKKPYKLKKMTEGKDFRYQVVDSKDNHYEYAEAKLIDNHYVLVSVYPGFNRIFGVEDKKNIKKADKRIKEKAGELLEERLEENKMRIESSKKGISLDYL